MKTSLKPGFSTIFLAPAAQFSAMTGESGNPSSAYLMAGASTVLIGSFP